MTEEYNYSMSLANIQQISDASVRERETSILEARRTYRERLELAAGNQQLEYDAWVEFLAAKYNAEQSYLERSSGIALQAAQATARSLSDAFRDMEWGGDIEAEQQAAELVGSVETEIDELRRQYSNGLVDYEEFTQRMNELDAERTDALEKAAEAQQSVWEQLNDAMVQAFSQVAESAEQSVADNIDSYNNLVAARIEADEYIAKKNEELAAATAAGNQEQQDKITAAIAEASEAREQIAADEQKALSAAYENTGVVVSATFAQMVADGESATKALVVAGLKGLQALVPIIVTKIMGAQLSALGPAGFVTAGLLTGALYAALGVAEAKVSALSFREGGYKPGGGPTGMLSSGMKIVMLNDDGTGRPEYVMNAGYTQRYGNALDVMNRQMLSPSEYVRRYENITVNTSNPELRAIARNQRAMYRELRQLREERNRYPVNLRFKGSAKKYFNTELSAEVRR